MPLPTYLMSNFPSVRPSLNLQFDSQPTPEDMTSHLASVGATFSRASIGTYTDANGLIQEASAGQARPNYSTAGVHEGLLIEESRTNLIKSSEDFSTTDWTVTSGGTGSNPIVTTNQAIAPDGTASADKIVFDLGGGTTTSDNSTIFQSLTLSTISYSGTIYLKGESGGESVLFRTVTGAYTELTLTTEWQRFELTDTYVSGTRQFEFKLRGGIVGGLNDTATVYAWGAQLEAGSFPTSYIPTIPTFTSRASDGTYFDSSGVLQTTSGERIDHKYIDGQWVEAGLLLEGASTNLHPNSGNLTGNNTAVNEVSLSLQTVTNPIDGQTQVTQITDTAVNDAHYIQSSVITADGSSDYTFSILAKAGTLSTCRLVITGGGAGTIGMIVDLSDGSILSGSGTVEDVANGWYKLSMTATSTTVSVLASRIYTTDGTNITYTGSGEYIYVAYRQLEVGSQPTSYIPTGGATVTRSADVYTTATKERSADVCYIDGTAFTDFYNQEEGTFFVFWQGFTDGGIDRWIGVNDTTLDNRIIFALSTNAETLRLYIETNDSAQTSTLTDTNVLQTTPNKYAIALAENDVDSYQDGSFVASDAVVSLPTVTRLTLDNGTGSGPFQGYIRKLIYFPRRLSDNELIKLTQ